MTEEDTIASEIEAIRDTLFYFRGIISVGGNGLAGLPDVWALKAAYDRLSDLRMGAYAKASNKVRIAAMAETAGKLREGQNIARQALTNPKRKMPLAQRRKIAAAMKARYSAKRKARVAQRAKAR